MSIQPQTGDRGPVMDALDAICDAAGGLEHSREAFSRVMAIAQEEFDQLQPFTCPLNCGVERILQPFITNFTTPWLGPELWMTV